MVELTGAAGVVVGRGCLGRPWLFRDLAAAFSDRWVPEEDRLPRVPEERPRNEGASRRAHPINPRVPEENRRRPRVPEARPRNEGASRRARLTHPRVPEERPRNEGASRRARSTLPTLPTLGEVSVMMHRHAELLAQHMGEERGCKEFRKHVTWYLKGFPAGGDLRRDLALVDTVAELDALLGRLDPDAPFPVGELGAPRGRQGSPRKGVALPEGWLDDTDGSGCVLREDARETTGG
ncbi:MAG: tRNA-dihydrouridine synthase [Marmoricola sp.]|nr:tRNA-dihydrouridine synthase [Marmoricola sp.]